jgi:hypothetical protein
MFNKAKERQFFSFKILNLITIAATNRTLIKIRFNFLMLKPNYKIYK